MSLDMNAELLNGDKTPAQVFSDIASAVDTNLLEANSTDTPKNYNALTLGDQVRKDVNGSFKTPRAAELGVIDMATGKYIAKTTKFILTGVSRPKIEKYQVTHGFDEEWLMTVFGKDISLYTISGVLINGNGEKDWVHDFDEIYDSYLRASVCVDRGWQVYIKYSNRIIRGYIVGKMEADDSEAEAYINFSANFLVRKDTMIKTTITSVTQSASTQ